MNGRSCLRMTVLVLVILFVAQESGQSLQQVKSAQVDIEDVGFQWPENGEADCQANTAGGSMISATADEIKGCDNGLSQLNQYRQIIPQPDYLPPAEYIFLP